MHWKNYLIKGLFVAILLAGCGKDPVESQDNPGGNSGSGSGSGSGAELGGPGSAGKTFASEKKNLSMKPIPFEIAKGKKVDVTYEFTDRQGKPVDISGYRFEVKTFMPEHKHPWTDGVVTPIDSNKIRVRYDIAMDGLWEFTVVAKKAELVVDKVIYRYRVGE